MNPIVGLDIVQPRQIAARAEVFQPTAGSFSPVAAQLDWRQHKNISQLTAFLLKFYEQASVKPQRDCLYIIYYFSFIHFVIFYGLVNVVSR